DEARNRSVFGAKAGTAQYGCNYVLEVTLQGEPDPETGMVVDLKRLKEIMEREIGGRFDHRNLNEDTRYFRSSAPTAENLRNLWALLEISKALNSTLRLDDVLNKVIEAVLALTRAERGMLLLGEDADHLLLRVQRNFDTSDLRQTQYSSSVVADVFNTGRPRILTDAAQDAHFSGQESIVGLNLRTVMCVPLRLSHRISEATAGPVVGQDVMDLSAGDTILGTVLGDTAKLFSSLEEAAEDDDGGTKMIGVIYVDRRSPTHFFTDQDLALFESFTSHATMAIDNARLYEEALEKRRLEQEIEVAREIQQSLLPHQFPELPWAQVYGRNLPSRQVGGDYYEVFKASGESLGLAVGDVSGKGVPAALLMSTLQSSFLAESAAQKDLAKVCEHVNQFLVQRTTPERYATFFVGHVDPGGKLLYVNAGHNPPMLLRQGEVQRLTGGGLPLGLFADRTYEVQQRDLQSGDLLLCYTDGVTEAGDPSEEEFGEQRLLEVIDDHPGADVCTLAEEIFAAVAKHSEGLIYYHDDVTLVLLRYL
ncbi:MAG: SpoIIE family protein phosphatase, partial [Acidobacteriota bacterium]